mgnify:CR=1 FL=1
MIGKLIRILKHPRVIRDALTNAVWMVDGDVAEKAICGLTEEETAALVRWLPDEGTFVEFGTLFGLTAKAVAAVKPKLKVIAVDNFSWNPFGLPPKLHEQFTRKILANEIAAGRITVVNATSEDFRRGCKAAPDAVFFDAQHEYEPVRDEIAWAKKTGVRCIMGHDYKNPSKRFGVTQAVDEAFQSVDVVGMCWKAK